jgi:hypothetical protein
VLFPALKEVFGDSTLHYSFNCILDGCDFRAGLNLLAEFNGLSAHFQSLSNSLIMFLMKVNPNQTPHPNPPEPAKTGAASNKPMSRPAIRACFWDLNRFKYQGKALLNIRSFSFEVLTGTIPYHKDCLRFHFKALNISHFGSVIDTLISNLKIERITFNSTLSNPSPSKANVMQTLVNIPLIEFRAILNWGASNNYLFFLTSRDHQIALVDNFLSKKLMVEAKCHFPKISQVQSNDKSQWDTIEDLVSSSDVPIIHYEANIFNDLINLPQLRHEYLRLHGIRPSNYKQKGTEADISINKQKVAVCSNYMELLTYSLNQALNRKEENLIKFISQISLKLHTTSIRLIASNKDTSTRILRQLSDEHKKLEDDCIVVGFQSIIESVTYSSTFVKKKLEFFNEGHSNVAPLRQDNPPKDPSGGLMVWVVQDGRGEINCFVAGYLYKHFKLIQFDKEALTAYKNAVWNISMDNKKQFLTFFGLNLESASTYTSEANSPTTQSDVLTLFNHDRLHIDLQCVHGPSDDCSLSPTTPSPKQPTKFSPDTNPFVNYIKLSPAEEFTLRMKSSKLEDKVLEFNQNEVFFTTKLIIYEFSKKREIMIQNKDELVDEHIIEAKFDHFVSLFDSRICIVYSLFKVITALMDIKQEKNLNKKKMAEKKKQIYSNSNDDDGTEEFKTSEDIKWKDQELEKEVLKKMSLMEDHTNLNPRPATGKAQESNTSYVFGMVITKPQFNFNDYLNYNQTIFTSKEECFIYLQKDTLKYDYFQMDPRFIIKILFKDLELFNSKFT